MGFEDQPASFTESVIETYENARAEILKESQQRQREMQKQMLDDIAASPDNPAMKSLALSLAREHPERIASRLDDLAHLPYIAEIGQILFEHLRDHAAEMEYMDRFVFLIDLRNVYPWRPLLDLATNAGEADLVVIKAFEQEPSEVVWTYLCSVSSRLDHGDLLPKLKQWAAKYPSGILANFQQFNTNAPYPIRPLLESAYQAHPETMRQEFPQIPSDMQDWVFSIFAEQDGDLPYEHPELWVNADWAEKVMRTAFQTDRKRFTEYRPPHPYEARYQQLLDTLYEGLKVEAPVSVYFLLRDSKLPSERALAQNCLGQILRLEPNTWTGILRYASTLQGQVQDWDYLVREAASRLVQAGKEQEVKVNLSGVKDQSLYEHIVRQFASPRDHILYMYGKNTSGYAPHESVRRLEKDPKLKDLEHIQPSWLPDLSFKEFTTFAVFICRNLHDLNQELTAQNVQAEYQAIQERREALRSEPLFKGQHVLLVSNSERWPDGRERFGTQALQENIRRQQGDDQLEFRHVQPQEAASPDGLPSALQKLRHDIIDLPVPATVFFDMHGSPKAAQLSAPDAAEYEQILVTEFAQLLVSRHKKWQAQGGILEDKFIFAQCLSSDFVRNLTDIVRSKNCPMPELTYASAELGQESWSNELSDYGDDLLGRTMRMDEENHITTVGDLIQNDESVDTNPTLMVPRPQSGDLLMQISYVTDTPDDQRAA